MSQSHDNRRSFRVVEPAFISYETVTESVYQRGFEFWKMSQGTGVGLRSKIMDIDARLSQKLFVLKSESMALAECFALLNDKISALIEELPGIKESKISLAQQSPQECEIGADGMTFSAAETFPAETKLALRFLLASDNRYVETFCRVVRSVEPMTEDPLKPHGLAVEFLGMKPEQQDILVQHLFDRESETLRMRRLKLDEDIPTTLRD